MFGNYVVEQIDAEWKVIIDQNGTDLTVVIAGGSTVFPIDMVLKRVQGGNVEFDFFNATFVVIQSIIS